MVENVHDSEVFKSLHEVDSILFSLLTGFVLILTLLETEPFVLLDIKVLPYTLRFGAIQFSFKLKKRILEYV